MNKLHVITPVKNSIHTTLLTIASVCNSRMDREFQYTVYDDFSDEETVKALVQAKERFHFELVSLSSLTQHPSPNYLMILQIAQQKALEDDAHLVIVESDVVLEPDTLQIMQERARLPNAAMLGAVTTDEDRNVNFPYLHAKNYAHGSIKTSKRISFCCTLLSNTLLAQYDFRLLDKGKTWFDVSISHKALELGLSNYILTDTPVLHYPHSSRPWKNLKKTNPLLYYWQKFVLRREKI